MAGDEWRVEGENAGPDGVRVAVDSKKQRSSRSGDPILTAETAPAYAAPRLATCITPHGPRTPPHGPRTPPHGPRPPPHGPRPTPLHTATALKGSWAACAEGLEHPHTKDVRPITFDESVSRGRDDVVLVHLNHRLPQMCLRLLRAEVWADKGRSKLQRVTARVVPNDVLEFPAVVAFARLVVIGGDSYRLARGDDCRRRVDQGSEVERSPERWVRRKRRLRERRIDQCLSRYSNVCWNCIRHSGHLWRPLWKRE
ncbi:MAG UNVERIFIED_CONTAM: hypothetical protein LVR18_45505 [Planctomycetaceae bacterium]